MNMKIKVIVAAILLILAYIVGCIFPISYLRPEFTGSAGLTKAEYCSIMTNFFVAIGTIAAVVVALFKDEIRKIFWKPNLELVLSDGNAKEDGVNIADEHPTAKRHFNSVCVTNKGTACANDCSVVVEEIEFLSHVEGTSPTRINFKAQQINWESSSPIANVDIPINGNKTFEIFEVLPSNQESTPAGNNSVTLPKLMIGDVWASREYRDGKWVVKGYLYFNASVAKRFSIEINWDGKWHNRKSEMDKHITCKINTNY